jgi:hypothetical protein
MAEFSFRLCLFSMPLESFFMLILGLGRAFALSRLLSLIYGLAALK